MIRTVGGAVEQSLSGAVTMEGIKRRIDALKSLGSNLGGGRCRIWILLNEYNERVMDQLPEATPHADFSKETKDKLVYFGD
jgi:hypothetical protein